MSYFKINAKEHLGIREFEGEYTKSLEQPTYSCLSFEYFFEHENDTVFFAYCPPYTYSQLKHQIL